MKKIISIVVLILACAYTSHAQYAADALRFSQTFPSLSARTMAMGGAFTSLGGDFSSSYINPAGLGLYRKSEFVFSPGLGYSTNKAEYFGLSTDDYKYQFIMGNLGYVGTYNSNQEKGLVSASYAIGYNRLNNFNSNTLIEGTNNNSSYSDFFVESATNAGAVPDNLLPFSERLFYDAWVIDNQGTESTYASLVPVPVDQSRSIITKGGTGEYTFAGALNFSNTLYFGLSLGINHLNYEQITVHSEVNRANLGETFRSFDYKEDLDVEATGVTFRLGMMARVTKALRLGGSFSLPTFYNVEEEYFSSITSAFDDSSFTAVPTDIDGNELGAGLFSYKLNTPMKVAGGISYQIGKAGIISGDVEYVNYASMKMRTSDDYNSSDDRDVVRDENSKIDDMYRSVFNFRLGGEVRLGNFAVRVGGAYYPSPYVSDELNKDANFTEITSGVGYRDKNFFFDLGFSGLLHDEKYNLYTSGNTDNIASLTQNKYRFIATIGFRF